jgi:D-3-phosphoglycerate dehydrogenase
MGTIAILQDLGVDRARVEELVARILPGWTVRWATDPGPVAGRASGAEIVVTVNEPVDRAALETVRPRLVSISFTGTDHVDLEAARGLGIAVTNVPSYATASVAELTVGLVVSLMRMVVAGDGSVRAGTWRTGLTGIELEGKTVGVVGTGRIGTAVTRRLVPFGCTLIGTSRSRPRGFVDAGGTHVELDELLGRSHVVTLHVPLTDATRGLVGARELGLMRRDAILVNTARGPVVDTDALVTALGEGRIAGAAVDVYDAEPIPDDHPLLDAPNTILLPHVAFATREALERKAVQTLENIRDHLAGADTNRVDAREDG